MGTTKGVELSGEVLLPKELPCQVFKVIPKYISGINPKFLGPIYQIWEKWVYGSPELQWISSAGTFARFGAVLGERGGAWGGRRRAQSTRCQCCPVVKSVCAWDRVILHRIHVNLFILSQVSRIQGTGFPAILLSFRDIISMQCMMPPVFETTS